MSNPSPSQQPQKPQKPQQDLSQYQSSLAGIASGTAQQQPPSAPQQQQQPVPQQQGAAQYPVSPQYPAAPQNTATPHYPGAPRYQYPPTPRYPVAPQTPFTPQDQNIPQAPFTAQNAGMQQNSPAPQYQNMPPAAMAPQPAWMPQQARDTRPMNGLAVASLPVGIVGIILSVIPQLNMYGLFLGIVGLILSIIGICQTGPTRPTRGRGIAIVGTVFSGLAVVLTIAFCILLITALTSYGDGGFDYDDEDDTGSETGQEENVHQTDDTVDRIIRQAMAEKER